MGICLFNNFPHRGVVVGGVGGGGVPGGNRRSEPVGQGHRVQLAAALFAAEGRGGVVALRGYTDTQSLLHGKRRHVVLKEPCCATG